MKWIDADLRVASLAGIAATLSVTMTGIALLQTSASTAPWGLAGSVFTGLISLFSAAIAWTGIQCQISTQQRKIIYDANCREIETIDKKLFSITSYKATAADLARKIQESRKRLDLTNYLESQGFGSNPHAHTKYVIHLSGGSMQTTFAHKMINLLNEATSTIRWATAWSSGPNDDGFIASHTWVRLNALREICDRLIAEMDLEHQILIEQRNKLEDWICNIHKEL